MELKMFNIQPDQMLQTLGLVCLVISLTGSDPYKWLLEKIWSDKWIPYTYFLRLLSCPMCLSFWILIIMTLNPLIAGIGFCLSKIICELVWK